MTLDGLTKIEPRDFFAPAGDEETFFTKTEVNRIIKYLGAFDLTLNKMVTTNKYQRIYGREDPVLIEETNLELEKKPTIEYGRKPTDAEVDKAFEEAEAFQKKVDAETTTPAVI